MGSRRAARRAGAAAASNTAAHRTGAAADAGSPGSTWNRSERNRRAAPRDPAIPSATPAAVQRAADARSCARSVRAWPPGPSRNAQIAPPAHRETRASGPGNQAGGSRADGAYDWETYYAVIGELDAGIGRVVDAVEKSGQWDSTLILSIGHNGYLCGSRGLQGKVHPWEASIRVPFMAAGGLVARGIRSGAAVASIDVPATILDCAGVRPSHKLAGKSMRAVLAGGRFSREAAFSSWNDGRPEALAIRQAVEPYRLASFCRETIDNKSVI
jgi:arylsulfatase A-like enzyme